MKSKWSEIKDRVIEYRLAGNSLRNSSRKFSIPKATLSGWFKNVKLSSAKKKILDLRWRKSLVKARAKSVIWHNNEKRKRIELAENDGKNSLDRLKFDSNEIELNVNYT